MRTYFLAILLAGLGGCSSIVRQPFDLSTDYRRDIVLDVEGFDSNNRSLFRQKNAPGVVSIAVADHYTIKGSVKQDIDFLVWQTCSSQKTLERVGDDFTIPYMPNPIERACGGVLEIRGVEEKLSRQSGAIIVFDDPLNYKMTAQMICNGDNLNSKLGVTACQSHSTLIQQISFDVPVFVKWAKPECALDNAVDGKSFVFKMPMKKCAYVFTEIGGAHRRHLLLLFPYQDVIITREGD